MPEGNSLIAALSEATSGEAETVAQQPEPAKTFTVVVKGKYFRQMKSGNKWREYRVIKPHWTNRLIDAKTGKNKRFDTLKITWGYTSDLAKIITLPWRGYEIIEGFIHPHFDSIPTDVYAIKLTEETTR